MLQKERNSQELQTWSWWREDGEWEVQEGKQNLGKSPTKQL